jgi:hypothetical protein
MKIYEKKYVGDDDVEHVDTRTMMIFYIQCEHSTNKNKKCEISLMCENMQAHNENENDEEFMKNVHNVEIYYVDIDGCDYIINENDCKTGDLSNVHDCIYEEFMKNVS